MDFKFDVCGFEHTHLHSTIGSLLDGYGKPEEYAQRAKKNNHQFLCISDHGSMAAIPQQVKAANDYGLHFIAACELYVNNHQPSFRSSQDYKKYVEELSPDDKLKLKKSYHVLAIAHSNQGYSNLVKLSTLAWSVGYGGLPRRPRVTHKQLVEYKEGITFTSCCCLSEIAVAFDTGGEEAGEAMLLKYLEMFGSNFYLELMLLDFKKQKPYDAFLIKMHDKYHIPLTISNDVHYCEKEDSKYQTYMLLTRGKKKIADLEKASSVDPDGEQFELFDKNLWMKSESEMNEKWLSDYRDAIPYELFCDAKRNTVKICEKARGVILDRSIKLPKIPDADALLKESVMRGFKWRGLPANDKRYISQLRKEYELIVRKDFSSYFLIKKMMTDEARRICPEILGWGTGEEAIGPGRGCLAGDSLIILKDNVIKPIKDVAVDDLVLNRDGKFRKVVRKFEYNCSEDLYEITTTEDAEHPLKLTGDHKVYVSVEQSMGWRRADSLSVGDIAFKPSAEPFKNSCFVPIISIKKVKNPTNKVYDIQIEGDDEHNYCTTSCLVHNSAVSFLTCYVLGITDVNPIYHNLIPERFLSDARGGKMMRLPFNKDPDQKGLILRGSKYLVD